MRSRQIALAAAQTPFPHAPGSRRWRGGGYGRRSAGGRCEALPGPAGCRPRRDLPWLRGAGGAGSGGANILALGGTKATRFALSHRHASRGAGRSRHGANLSDWNASTCSLCSSRLHHWHPWTQERWAVSAQGPGLPIGPERLVVPHLAIHLYPLGSCDRLLHRCLPQVYGSCYPPLYSSHCRRGFFGSTPRHLQKVPRRHDVLL